MSTEDNKAEDGHTENLAAEALREALEGAVDPKDVEIASLKDEVAGGKDRLLRLAAEMENLRKRTEREKAEATLYAATNFARDLLSVADNLGRALQALPHEERDRAGEAEKNLIAGVELTERDLLAIFARHGIRKIETVGAKFDPNYHQAIFEVPTKEKPPGIVMQELQSGFQVGERCLRPAMVGVSKAE
ncbi:MAG: nucleotide exchange factor GrpE [Alphaproteobacteria bacterium]|nr:nucleotide exchange factor GrpE [Alphaproteobacteria bacterium]